REPRRWDGIRRPRRRSWRGSRTEARRVWQDPAQERRQEAWDMSPPSRPTSGRQGERERPRRVSGRGKERSRRQQIGESGRLRRRRKRAEKSLAIPFRKRRLAKGGKRRRGEPRSPQQRWPGACPPLEESGQLRTRPDPKGRAQRGRRAGN